jgi:hypothetical protein
MEVHVADSCLLVPMHLDAMVVTDRSVSNTFVRFQMDYRALQNFDNPEPEPNSGQIDARPEGGIHLHWTLPKALRQGIHREETGATDFELIPNRWLIVRISEGADAGLKAWLIESDYVGNDGTTPYLDPKATTADQAQPVLIGGVREFAAVESAASTGRLFLKAVAPGSVLFSAYAPAVQNVLSFRDSLNNINAGTFTYTVTGWYSDPTQDPLKDSGWEQQKENPERYSNKKFDWIVCATSANLPNRTLLHALVHKVPWDRSGDNVPATNYPKDTANTVKVSIGNTAIDAIAGLMSVQKGPRYGDLLAALQYGLLDDFDVPGSAEQLNAAIRQHWFAPSPGGTLWTITSSERPEGAFPEPPTDAEKSALATLNAAQNNLDREQRILESMQMRLYSLWWKSGYLPRVDKIPAPIGTGKDRAKKYEWYQEQLNQHVDDQRVCAGTDPEQQSWYFCKVKAQWNRVEQLKPVVANAKSAVEALLPPDPAKPDKKKRQLKSVNLPQFFHPNDPVVLITGLGRSTKFDPSRGVMCRLVSQTIAELTVDGTLFSTIAGRGTDIRAKIPQLQDPKNLLPIGVQQLHTESVLLTPGLLTTRIGKSRNAIVDAIDKLPKLPGPTPDARFASSDYSREEWRQPWVPLLLDWNVTIMKGPAYTPPKNDEPYSEFRKDRWTFDGTDYVWNDTTKATADDFSEHDTQIQAKGRTFITPQLAFTFAAQLKEYVQKHKDQDPTLTELLPLVRELETQDILSQRLSGLLGMMVERAYRQTLHPTGEIGRLLDKNHPAPPLPNPNALAPPILDFAPMSGVFFVVNKLAVIDTFGRMVNVMVSNFSTSGTDPNKNQYFYPFTGRGLTPLKLKLPERTLIPISKPPAPGNKKSNDATEQMLQLLPRFLQDSRLLFRLVSNEGRNENIHLAASANPICGWVVPNHLDRSLALYAPDGSAWGELFLSLRHDPGPPLSEKSVPVWQPDPTNPNAPKTLDAIPNAYVRGLLQTLTGRASSDGGNAFNAFLRSIDETMWTIDSRGDRQDQNLAVMVGRPLAIVRAEMALCLRGLPYTNQDWERTFINPDFKNSEKPHAIGTENGGVFTHSWEVRLGSATLPEDGLIGYFVDDPTDAAKNFSAFNCIAPRPDTPSDFVRKIGAPNSYPMLRPVDDSVAAWDPRQNQVARLSLLVDPRYRVHAYTGLLPVLELEIPDEFVTAPLQKISYMFRVGPLLTPPEEVRTSLPFGVRGVWSWFDKLTNSSAPVFAINEGAVLTGSPQVSKEGWLNFKPDDGLRLDYTIAPVSGPIRVGASLDLRIGITNPAGEAAVLTKVAIVIPNGKEIPTDLSADRNLPSPTVESSGDWEVRITGNEAVLVPKSGNQARVNKGQPIVFVLKGIRVNSQPGSVKIAITEHPYPASDANSGVRILDKF